VVVKVAEGDTVAHARSAPLGAARIARLAFLARSFNRRVPAGVDAVRNGPLGDDYLECAAPPLGAGIARSRSPHA